MTVLGNVMVMVALGVSAISAILYYRSASVPKTPLVVPRRFMWLSALLVVVASLLLLLLFIRHDYTNGYVYSYSDNGLPLHFLLSSFYAGQQGSFLFWALCSGIIGVVLAGGMRRRGSEAAVMAVYMAVQSLLLILVLVKTPFVSLWELFPAAPATMPADGHGLNPLLQNFWMVIHPPVLFVGFAIMQVPFALALAGLWRKEFSILTERGFPWVLAATSVLGLGIMLGAYWAYGVLGWGGYWGWDPVENSSLVPWLTGIALLHTMLAQLRTNKYVRTNFILASVSFLLVVYSTFLTRSGILGDASVHAFADAGATVYWVLLGTLVVLSVASAGLIAVRWKELRPDTSDKNFLTRETALGAGTITLVLCAVVVLFGTSLPIFSTTRVEPSFYDATTLPIAVVMALLIGYSLFMQWEQQDGRETFRRSLVSLVAALLCSGALFAAGVRDVSGLLLIFTSLFALFVNIEIGVKIIRGDPRFLGGKFAHAGIALFFIGVIAAGQYQSKEHAVLPLNTPREVLGHTLTYTGYEPIDGGKFAFNIRVGTGNEAPVMAPVMFETGEQGVMRNPDILTKATRDFYVSPVSLQEGTRAANAGETYTITKGSAVSMGDVKAKFISFDMGSHSAEGMGAGSNVTIGSVIELSAGKATETIVPALMTAGGQRQQKPAVSRLMNATVTLVDMKVSMGTEASSVTLQVQRAGGANAEPEALVIEASIKPYINLLWGGTLVMMVGFILAILKRSKEA